MVGERVKKFVLKKSRPSGGYEAVDLIRNGGYVGEKTLQKYFTNSQVHADG